MTHAERFKVKAAIDDSVRIWELERQNLLLEEFGIEPFDPSWNGSSFGNALKDADDAQLVEMYGVVFGIDPDDVVDTVATTYTDGNWKPGFLRLFISHSAQHKSFASEVASHLGVVGIHGFVAHDTMEPTRSWQSQIEIHLRSMQAFVLLAHSEVNDSAWCHQEVGWALGRRTPHYVIRVGCDPSGFIGRDQWNACAPGEAKTAANLIIDWVASLDGLGGPMFDRLLAALRDAGNYVDAGAAAEKIAALGALTSDQFDRLDAVWRENDQLHGGVLPTRAIQPLYRANSRPFPPPAPPATLSVEENDEPF